MLSAKVKEELSQNLRFELNPIDIFNSQTHFRISGEVSEMNCFCQDRWDHGLEIGFYKE